METITVQLPQYFQAREYQKPIIDAFMLDDIKRGLVVAHRRSGKDSTALAIIVQKMMERVGSYLHLFPFYSQARKSMWHGSDRDGIPFMDRFPSELIQSKNETEMRITLHNGSSYQLVGTDRSLDSLVGGNPIGLVLSEYALMNPKAWRLLSPILLQNDGWALFISTPRGENHLFEMYEQVKDNPKWYTTVLTINDTKQLDGSPVISEEDIQSERDSGISDEMIDSEYYCSFQAAIPGAYFAKEMKQCLEENRITSVPYEPSIEVEVYWDLGIRDAMALWFLQQVGNEVRLIDCYQNTDHGLLHYLKVLKEKPYVIGRNVGPHDIEVRELASGVSRREFALQHGVKFDVLPNTPKEEQIDAARRILNKCWFDEQKCRDGIAALRNYHKEYDEKYGVYKTRPVHNAASHFADAFMYLAIGIKPKIDFIKEPIIESDYSVFDY